MQKKTTKSHNLVLFCVITYSNGFNTKENVNIKLLFEVSRPVIQFLHHFLQVQHVRILVQNINQPTVTKRTQRNNSVNIWWLVLPPDVCKSNIPFVLAPFWSLQTPEGNSCLLATKRSALFTIELLTVPTGSVCPLWPEQILGEQ